MQELRFQSSAENLPLSRTSSAISMTSTRSTRTFLPDGGGIGGSLEQLCKLIDAFTSLRDAEIVSSECFAAPLRLGIVHRFLLIELRRGTRKPIWVRIERRRDNLESSRTFIFSGARSRANNSVSATVMFVGPIRIHPPFLIDPNRGLQERANRDPWPLREPASFQCPATAWGASTYDSLCWTRTDQV